MIKRQLSKGTGVEGARSLTSDLVDTLSEPLDVVRSNAGNRDATVLGGIHRELLNISLTPHNYNHNRTSSASLVIWSDVSPVYANMPI